MAVRKGRNERRQGRFRDQKAQGRETKTRNKNGGRGTGDIIKRSKTELYKYKRNERISED